MNESEVEELLRRSAPVEAPFGPRRPTVAPPTRRSWVVPLVAAAGLFAAALASVLNMSASDEAERHVRLLESSDVATREAAARTLLRMGHAAKAVLERAARHGSADLRERARTLLHRIRVQDVEKRGGKLTEGGDFWIGASAYSEIAKGVYPDWMKANFLRDQKNHLLLVNESDGTLTSMLARVDRPDSGSQSQWLPSINVVWGPNDVTFQVFRDDPIAMERRDLAELFERWPRLRASSMVVVCGSEVLTGLERALSSDDPRLRTAAAHGLRHVFQDVSVSLALGALDDPDERVRATARDTLRVLVNPPVDSDPRAWWRDMTLKDRHLRARCDERRRELSR